MRKSQLTAAQMITLYRAAHSTAAIARQAGIDSRCVRRHLTRRGVHLHVCRAATIRIPDHPMTLQRLACYLDCEGTIIVRAARRAIYTRIAITNTHVPLMTCLVDTVGGTVRRSSAQIPGRHQNAGSKPCYDRWLLRRSGADWEGTTLIP